MGDEPIVTLMDSYKKVASTRNSAIVVPNMGGDFSIKGLHIQMVQEISFDGAVGRDPHVHVAEFLSLCKIFRYGEKTEEAAMLSLFPLSLTQEAKKWLTKLPASSIHTWEELRKSFCKPFLSSRIVMGAEKQNPSFSPK